MSAPQLPQTKLRIVPRPTCLALAVLLFVTLLPGALRAQDDTTAEKRARARKYYTLATNYHDLGKYESAIDAFEKAYELYPNSEFFYLIAESHRAAGHKEAALEHYQKYLAEEPSGRVSDKARQAVETITRELEAEKEAARKKAEEDAKRKKAEEDAKRKKAAEDAKRKKAAEDAKRKKAAEDANRRATPGRGRAETADARVLTDEGDQPDAHIADEPSGTPGRGLRIGGLVGAGVGIIAIGVGVKFGLDARSINSELERAADDPQERWSASYDARYADGEAAERNMLVMCGIGAAALVAGAVTYYLGSRSGGNRKRGRQNLSIVPTLHDSTPGVLVETRF